MLISTKIKSMSISTKILAKRPIRFIYDAAIFQLLQ